jgi:hypothetical protein
VFLNACGSGDLDPAGANSFPELFLKKDFGFLGFIGTETIIPDEFAGLFSEVFYEYLLAGMSIGDALRAARWNLLKLHHNPLGIVYSLYAEPEIRVRHPVVALRYVPRHCHAGFFKVESSESRSADLTNLVTSVRQNRYF